MGISSGDATVQAGPGGQLEETGTVHYYLIRPAISWRHTAAGLHIGGGCLTIPLYPCRVSLHLTIPAGHPASVTDGVGNLTADGLHGPVSLRTNVGNVRAIGLDGPSRITGRAAEISVTGAAGPSLTIRDLAGNIATSDVTTPSVTVVNVTGDIVLRFTAVPRHVQITDGAGDVTVQLPPGRTKYRVSAATSVGSSSVNVPTDPSSANVITVTDSVGDISISR